MAISESEALASLRILVAMARADGTIANDERKSLAAALGSLELPGGTSVEKLLAEEVDVDARLAELVSPEAKEQLYRSAYFMAYADGTCTKDEEKLLERIAAVTKPTAAQRASLSQTFVTSVSAKDATVTTPLIRDPQKRSAEARSQILRFAILSAALGAFPIPGLAIATDLAVIATQVTMIRSVGSLWGHVVDKQAAKSLLYGVGLGTGARLAVNNLAKLIPGWGSVVGATTSFVSTYALGLTIEKMYDSGQPATAETLRVHFKTAEEQARSVYADQHDVIIESQRRNKPALDSLTAALKAGHITQDEFDREVSALA
jgi:uncharacterized protein (DUF697 family)